MDGTRSHELIRAISAHAQRKQLASAVAAFEQLLTEGHAPSIFAFCSLINAHCACADMPGALCACERMLAAGVQPNAVVLTTLIKGYVNAGETERAHALLDEMTRERAAPSAVDGARRSIWAACERVRPDTRAVNALLRGCARTGHAALAAALFERMTSEWHLEPDVTTYKLVAKLLAMALDTRSLRGIVRSLAPGGPEAEAEAEGGGAEEDDDSGAAALGGPVCMFWREGANSLSLIHI